MILPQTCFLFPPIISTPISFYCAFSMFLNIYESHCFFLSTVCFKVSSSFKDLTIVTPISFFLFALFTSDGYLARLSPNPHYYKLCSYKDYILKDLFKNSSECWVRGIKHFWFNYWLVYRMTILVYTHIVKYTDIYTIPNTWHQKTLKYLSFWWVKNFISFTFIFFWLLVSLSIFSSTC